MTLREKLSHHWSTWALLCAVTLLFLGAGCQVKATAKLPPGALNTFDADSYRVLSDAHAVVQSIHDDAAAGKVTLNDGQTALINHVIADDNTADHLYQAYHANASGDTTALSQAIQQLISDLASLSTAFPTQTAPATPPAK
ncbi:MAG TPA: hypothetical protein VK604_01370 [Bryobacteraceae bacterium]|nr:hypothetical protein [Bryobacteraceae bacterium]